MATLKKADKVASATTSNPKKKVTKIVKITKSQADDKNIKETVKKVVESVREVKYVYPADIDTQEKKKAYRVKVRTKDKAFLKDIDTATKAKNEKDLTSLSKKYAAFRKEHYLVP